MIQTWIKLITGPNENNYQEVGMSPDATFGTALLWRTIGIIIAAALGYIGSLMGLNNVIAQVQQAIASQPDMPPEAVAIFNQLQTFLTPAGLGFATIGGIVFSLLGFVIGAGIYHLIARMFGGDGKFGSFSYLLAGVWSPIGIIQGVLGLVPILGACLGIFVSIYGLVLSYFAIKTNYRLSDGRSILVLLMPLLLVIVLGFCGIFALGFLAAAIQNQ